MKECETLKDYLANLIKTLRKMKKLSQIELAVKSEVSLTAVRNLENAKSNPTLELLRRISNGLNMDLVIQFLEKAPGNEVEQSMNSAYRMIEGIVESEGKTYPAYGIAVGELRVENVTCDKERLIWLIEQCNRYQLEPESLPWILSDFLNDHAFYICRYD